RSHRSPSPPPPNAPPPTRRQISVFFFSSRRRHTRSKRDWSSDVCSSDLLFRRYDLVCLRLEKGCFGLQLPLFELVSCATHLEKVGSLLRCVGAVSNSSFYEVVAQSVELILSFFWRDRRSTPSPHGVFFLSH